MRSIWSGSISFGLVNIPVKLYPATVTRDFDFDYLHKKDLSPVRYARMCKTEDKEIPYQEIVRGVEVQEGDYVVVKDEEIKQSNLRKTKTIDILDFVKEDEINSIYFEKPYYLEPDKKSLKAYALLRESLAASKKVGIAKFVLRTKESLGILKVNGDILVLNQMRYANEIRQVRELTLPEKDLITSREIEMALALINQQTTKFEPEKYKDTYKEDLEKLIEEKARGVTPKVKGKEPEPTEVKDLMALLKASLEKDGSQPAQLSN